MQIGERIREKRRAEGLSQEHLARRADISLNVLNRLETGAVTNPHFATVVSLAEALDVSVGALLGETPAPLAQAPPDTEEVEERQELVDQIRRLREANARLAEHKKAMRLTILDDMAREAQEEEGLYDV